MPLLKPTFTTDKPIKYAFHSHNYWDHASSGQVFLDEGATTIAHAEAYAWMVGNEYLGDSFRPVPGAVPLAT